MSATPTDAPHVEGARDRVAGLWRALGWAADTGGSDIVADRVAPDAVWHVAAPFGDLVGVEGIEGWLTPLHRALGIVACHLAIVLAAPGPDDSTTVSVTGHLRGVQRADWLGIAAVGSPVSLRFGAVHRVGQDGRIGESWVLLDILDLANRAGVPNLPGRYDRRPVPDPAVPSVDGAVEADHAVASARSLALVEAMIDGLMTFDGSDLASMGMDRFWSDDMRWYGPGGIGSTRSLRGFEDLHQRPFLAAFPDRVGGGKAHVARFADGPFVATGGWPSVRASFGAAPYLGIPPHGGAISMRVMDWWRREGDLLVENWVLIDMIDLLEQLGRPMIVDGVLVGTGGPHDIRRTSERTDGT